MPPANAKLRLSDLRASSNKPLNSSLRLSKLNSSAKKTRVRQYFVTRAQASTLFNAFRLQRESHGIDLLELFFKLFVGTKSLLIRLTVVKGHILFDVVVQKISSERADFITILMQNILHIFKDIFQLLFLRI